MGKLADELSERSKRDDEMIVGSEIRAALQELCDEAQRWHERYLTASAEGAIKDRLIDTVRAFVEDGFCNDRCCEESIIATLAELDSASGTQQEPGAVGGPSADFRKQDSPAGGREPVDSRQPKKPEDSWERPPPDDSRQTCGNFVLGPPKRRDWCYGCGNHRSKHSAEKGQQS